MQSGDVAIIALALIISAFGIGFGVYAAFALERRLKAMRFGQKVEGRIDSFDTAPSGFGDVPYVRYRDGNGRSQRAALAPPHPRNIARKFPVGKDVTVRYDPGNPGVVYHGNIIQLLLGPIVMLLGGLLCMAIGWGIWNGM